MKRALRITVLMAMISMLSCVREGVGSGSESSDIRTNKIGVILPLSGRGRLYGESVLHGIQCAFGQVAPCSPTSSLELVVRDSKGDPNVAQRQFVDLVDKEHVMAVIGPLAKKEEGYVIKEAMARHVPLISLTQNESDSQMGESIFRLGLSSYRQVKTVVVYAMQKNEKRRFSIMYPDDGYGQEMKKIYADVVESLGGELVEERAYQPDLSDLIAPEQEAEDETQKEGDRPRIEIKQMLPTDVVFIPDSYRNVNQVAMVMGVRNFNGAILAGTNRWNNIGLIEHDPAPLEKSIFVDAFDKRSTDSKVSGFVSMFDSAFHLEPTILEAYGYDAGRIVVSAAKKRASRAQIVKNIAKTSGYHGATGVLSFDNKGNVVRPLMVYTVENGNIISAEPLTNEEQKIIDNEAVTKQKDKKSGPDKPVVADSTPLDDTGRSKYSEALRTNTPAATTTPSQATTVSVPRDATGRTKYGSDTQPNFGY